MNCAISGFGQNGPLRDSPAYDLIIQGFSGTIYVKGTEESGPLRVGFPLSDTIGEITVALCILTFLRQSKREAFFIDVSMLKPTMATMGYVISKYLYAGIYPQRMGNENFTSNKGETGMYSGQQYAPLLDLLVE